MDGNDPGVVQELVARHYAGKPIGPAERMTIQFMTDLEMMGFVEGIKVVTAIAVLRRARRLHVWLGSFR